jgi:hypothetical protein
LDRLTVVSLIIAERRRALSNKRSS